MAERARRYEFGHKELASLGFKCMGKKEAQIVVPDEVIMSKIYLIRGKRVILDRDLSELYNVETKQLKRSVRRNIVRFPEDFMFELTKDELVNWRYQFGTSNSEIMGLRIPPFAFTELWKDFHNSVYANKMIMYSLAPNLLIFKVKF